MSRCHRARLLLIGGVLLLGCCASAKGRMLTRTTPEDGDARAELVEERFALTEDGARTRHVLRRTKVHTEHAIDHLGDVRLRHDSATQKLEVKRADTFMRDKTKVSIKPNSVNETTPDALAATPAYASWRETVVTHVGMEVGCTNELEYQISSGRSKRPLWAEVPLQLPYPTDKHVVAVEVPKGTPFNWACVGCAVAPELKKAESAKATTHTFTWKALPSLNLAEDAHYHGHLYHPLAGQPRLVFSTAPSWKALVDDLANRFGAAAAPDDGIRARAAELTENRATPEQRALALWRFVAQDLATVAWPLDDLGHTPTSAAQVLERSYGHALDKAVLLTALLAAADITAVPVLVSRDVLVTRQVPTLAPFDDVWLMVELAGAKRWLPVTHLDAGPGPAVLEGRFALPLIDRSDKELFVLIAKTPYALGKPVQITAGKRGAELHQSVMVASVSLDPEAKISAEIDVTLTGTYNPFAEIDPKQGANSVTGGLLGSLGAGALKADGDEGRIAVRTISWDSSAVAFTAAGQARLQGRVMEVDLPFAARSQLLGIDLHRGARQLPMTLRSRGTERAVVTVSLPKGYALRSALPAGEVKNAVGRLVTTSREESGALVIERSLVLDKRVILPEDYPALRDLAKELWRADHRSLLFVRESMGEG